MKSAGIQIKNLGKQFDKNTSVLKDINLEIKPGEFVVLVGPSGCGKSTLLRIIAGLEKPSHGQIFINERLVNDVHPAERDLAMVFQDYALYPHMTIRENLSFGLRMNKVDKATIQTRVEEVARMLQISALLERKPAQLSGGQRQRVAIGRALAKNPSVFLFDEPLSNLDAKLRAQTRIELAELHKRLKTTTIYVTHDQVEAMTLAHRIVLLNKGDIQQVGTPLEMYNDPANSFVASFIGSPSMNFIEGKLQVEGGSKKFHFAFEGGHPESLDLDQVSTPQASGTYQIGVRPEKIHILRSNHESSSHSFSLQARVLMIEPLGHETLVIVKTGFNQQLTLRVSEPGELNDLVPDQPVSLGFSAKDLYWFDPNQRGARIKELLD